MTYIADGARLRARARGAGRHRAIATHRDRVLGAGRLGGARAARNNLQRSAMVSSAATRRRATAAATPMSDSSSSCAICLEEGVGDSLQRAVMPCCARENSTIAYCVPCMRIIVARAPGGRVGQCPTCRQHVSVDGDGVVHKAERRDTCLMCRQQRIIVDESCCSACLLGRRLGPLRYECDGCHRVQLIAHPMYRYQRDPLTFGTDTWACHAGCGTYTHWKVLPADADRIPPEECPESWGRRDEWLQEIRGARMVARMGNGAPAEERPQAAMQAEVDATRARLRSQLMGMAWTFGKLVLLGVVYFTVINKRDEAE